MTRNKPSNLSHLCQADINTFKTYQIALKKVNVAAMFESLKQFQMQHLHHIETLNDKIKAEGGVPVKNNTNRFKKFFALCYTVLRSMTGTEGALKAMLNNERSALIAYQEAYNQNSSSETKGLIKSYLDEEHKHVEHIEFLLHNKPWNPSGIPYR